MRSTDKHGRQVLLQLVEAAIDDDDNCHKQASDDEGDVDCLTRAMRWRTAWL